MEFSNVTGGGNDRIGARFGPGEVNSSQKFEARFRAQATSDRAELTILAVQLSDEATYQLSLLLSNTKTISSKAKVIVHCKY